MPLFFFFLFFFFFFFFFFWPSKTPRAKKNPHRANLPYDHMGVRGNLLGARHWALSAGSWMQGDRFWVLGLARAMKLGVQKGKHA